MRGGRWALALAVLLSGGAAQAESLHVYVGQGQMPYADDRVDNRGLYGDLMDALCLRLGHDCEYFSVPWKRVQHAVASDARGIVLNLGRTAEREQHFIWLLEVLPTRYVLASRGRRFDSLGEALRAGPLVVMAGTPRASEAQAARRAGQAVVEVTMPEQAAGMLHSGRVTSWYEIDQRILYLWGQLGHGDEPLLLGPPTRLTRGFIAASPLLKDAQSLAGQMQQAFKAMHEDGSWQQILQRHLAADRPDFSG